MQPPATIGILSFEVAGAMFKAVQLHRSLTPAALARLRDQVLRSAAVRHLVSADEPQLLALVAAEKLDQLTRVAAVVARLGRRCPDPALAGFEHVFADLLAGRLDPAQLGLLPARAMDAAVKKMARLAAATAALRPDPTPKPRTTGSLWNRTPREIAPLMARAVCTLLARIRRAFAGAAAPPAAPPSTVGGAALALRYSNLVIIIEKLLQYPHLVGEEARDVLYEMLPASLRAALRRKLRRSARELAIYDASVAFDWRRRLAGLLTWLSPVAHHMVTWQAERNFERSRVFAPAGHVILLQTLYFADRDKTEAALCDLLVGLNYICRYEQQRAAFDFDSCVD
ncbi:protein PSK SIMULATOR 1-like [Wolffia australiana]